MAELKILGSNYFEQARHAAVNHINFEIRARKLAEEFNLKLTIIQDSFHVEGDLQAQKKFRQKLFTEVSCEVL